MNAPQEIRWNVRAAVERLLAAHGRLAGSLLLLSVLFFPLAPNLVPVPVVLAFIIIGIRHRALKAKRWIDPLMVLPIFYLLHVVGMLWTRNTDFGLFDLGIKAPLLILPAFALMMKDGGRMGRDVLFFTFSIACVLAVLVCVVAAAYRIIHGSGLSPEQEVFSSRWSLILHPSYFAMYLTLCVAAWCVLPIGKAMPAWADRSVLAVLCIGVVLCGSKIGWMILIALLAALLVMRWRDRHTRTSIVGMLGVLVIGIAALVAGSSYARDRVKEVFRAATEHEHHADAGTSSEVRWLTWGTAWRLFKEHPFAGTGTGDIKDELVRSYTEHGYTTAAEHRLNAHDQFLQSAACLGLPGLLLLIAFFLAPFFSRRFRDPLMLAFLAISLVDWTVESMLEVQAGVMFFAFFACVVLWNDNTADHA